MFILKKKKARSVRIVLLTCLEIFKFSTYLFFSYLWICELSWCSLKGQKLERPYKALKVANLSMKKKPKCSQNVTNLKPSMSTLSNSADIICPEQNQNQCFSLLNIWQVASNKSTAWLKVRNIPHTFHFRQYFWMLIKMAFISWLQAAFWLLFF